jgi:hypothetical protein
MRILAQVLVDEVQAEHSSSSLSRGKIGKSSVRDASHEEEERLKGRRY